MDNNNDISLDMLFSLTLNTKTKDEIKYSAKLSRKCDENSLSKNFNDGWLKIEDEVFTKIEAFMKNQQQA